MRNHSYVAVGFLQCLLPSLKVSAIPPLLWWLPVGQGNVTACHQLQILQHGFTLSKEIQQMHTNEARMKFFISSNKQRNGKHQHAHR